MSPLRTAFEQEMRLAEAALAGGDDRRAYAHFERAHILGQRRPLWHVRSHWGLLRVGWRRRDGREWRGQLLRLPAALLCSWLWVPAGNTGGANVSAWRSLPLPEDLQRVLAAGRRG